jgi:hypothetical protein
MEPCSFSAEKIEVACSIVREMERMPVMVMAILSSDAQNASRPIRRVLYYLRPLNFAY